jgi:hypothetical protein
MILKQLNIKGDFFGCFLFMYPYVIQHCFICRPSHSTVSEDAGIEPRTVVILQLTARRSNHLARSHPQLAIDLNHTWLDVNHAFKYDLLMVA